MSSLLLLNADGTLKCRKPLPNIVNQSTIVGDGESTKFSVEEEQLAENMAGDGVSANSGRFDLNIQSDLPLGGKGTSTDKLKIAAEKLNFSAVPLCV